MAHERTRVIAIWLPILTSLLCIATAGHAKEPSELIADYATYEAVGFLHVSSGTVTAKRLGEKGLACRDRATTR
jgi:hypothetical protein